MEERNPSQEEETQTSHRPADFCVPRKKRMTKSQPRQIQSSIDVLAEVLAERCAEGVYESEEAYDPGEEDCDKDDDGGSSEDKDEESSHSTREQRAANRERDRAKRQRMEPYKFTKCKLRNRHFLREGQGLAMIRSLGLEQFLLHTEVPRFNKSYCTEFIATYSIHKGGGVVNGRLIKITAQAVRKLTGLPLGTRGDRAVVHDVRAEDLSVMDRLIPGLKRTSYGYDLRYLRYKDQTETFVAVASALSEKLVCRTFKLIYIKGAIVLAMETSLRLKILMQWAEFMAETIKSAIKLTKLRTRNVRFAFGEWLTGLIENALAEELEGEKGTGLVENGPSESSLDRKEEPLEDDAVLLLTAAGAPDGVAIQGATETAAAHPPREPEALPLVVHNQLTPHKIKKRSRTAAIMPAPSTEKNPSDDSMCEEVMRLRQQLAEAEKRERWYVTMNLSLSQELERTRMELENMKAAALAPKAIEPKQDQPEAEEKHEMPLVIREWPRNGEQQQQIERVIEHLEKKSVLHEQEVSRLKQELEDQRKLIELVKRTRATPVEVCKESMDRREQKRLRREWEKDKEKLKPTSF